MIARILPAVVTLAALGATAHADQDEASLEVHPTGGIARLGEDDTDQVVTVPVAGLDVAATYGVRDWLALGAEVGFARTGAGRFNDVPISIGGIPAGTATIDRRANLVRASFGATLRLGVRIIPVVFVGIGPTVRIRPDGADTSTGGVPDHHAAATSIDITAMARLGLDWRINRRWIAGLWAGGSIAVPIGAPSYQAAEAGLRIQYAWYPLF